MPDYNFSCLVDKEFEDLCIDLISAKFGKTVERFKAGKDQGIDGRFFTSPEKQTIIQCKHWLKSGFPALLKHLTQTEKPKIVKLNPNRYILITSLELSSHNKTQVCEALHPYVKVATDILGAEDLNILLQKFPNIEERHYKLWMSSTNVLNLILHAAIKGRSSFKLSEIRETSKVFVETKSFARARKKLEDLHTIILSGEPGVGKTTLADQIAFHHASQGYELCYISNSLNEAEAVFEPEKKQLFYFDDFLGRNYLEALKPHEDSHIASFIRRVAHDPFKRFVLTSRSNILYTGFHLSDVFDNEKISRTEYRIEIDDLTDMDKARILYNHMWFSDVSEAHLEQIYEQNRYLTIIRHKNFNPRLISFITSAQRLIGIDSAQYWNRIQSMLTNPKEIWRNVFDIQLDSVSRDIVIAVVLCRHEITEEQIKKFYYEAKNQNQNGADFKPIESILQILTGSLLNRTYIDWSNKTYYSLFNPSIADFVIATYIEDTQYISWIINCLKHVDAIRSLGGIHRSNDLAKTHVTEITIKLLLLAKNQTVIDDYLLALLLFRFELGIPSAMYLDFDKLILGSVYGADVTSQHIQLIGHFLKAGVTEVDDALLKHIEYWLVPLEHDFDFEAYRELSHLVLGIEPSGGTLTAAFKDSFLEFYKDQVTDDLKTEEVLPNLYNADSYDNTSADEFIESVFEDLAVFFDNSDLRYIREFIDVDSIVDHNTQWHDESEGGSGSDNEGKSFHISDIHDLFDRK